MTASTQSPEKPSKNEETVIARSAEAKVDEFRPAKWQSNVTIISCVCTAPPGKKQYVLTDPVYREFQ